MARAKAILLTPKSAWPVIATEPTTVADLYKGYIIPLAAIPAIFSFLKMSLIGTTVMFAGTYRVGVGAGLATMVVAYVLSLVTVYVVAMIVDALAPTFGGQKNNVQALKVMAYASTAGWVAGVAQVLPGLGMLIVIAAAIYGIYLLYLGAAALDEVSSGQSRWLYRGGSHHHACALVRDRGSGGQHRRRRQHDGWFDLQFHER